MGGSKGVTAGKSTTSFAVRYLQLPGATSGEVPFLSMLPVANVSPSLRASMRDRNLSFPVALTQGIPTLARYGDLGCHARGGVSYLVQKPFEKKEALFLLWGWGRGRRSET